GLHPSRLRAARQCRRFQRLVLPLPRLALRHLGPHPPRARAREPLHTPRRVRLGLRDQAGLRTMAGIPHPEYEPKTRIEGWVERRLPIGALIYNTIMI